MSSPLPPLCFTSHASPKGGKSALTNRPGGQGQGAQLSPAERSDQAFSLVELLVVVAIVGTLAALLFTALPVTRAAAQRTRCLSNLRQIGAASALYSSDHNLAPIPPNFWYALSDQGYLASNSTAWICPADKRTNKVTAGVGPISYAYNAQKLGLAPTYWTKASLGSLAALTNPAGLVYFSDATAYYMNKTKANQNADFRHQGDVNALYFDGHAATVVLEDPAKFYDSF